MKAWRQRLSYWMKSWLNRPRAEDYLPFSTTHQHKQTWRWPFIGLAGCFLAVVVLLGVLLGQQAQFERYTEQTRRGVCTALSDLQQANVREYRAYSQLDCAELNSE